MNTNQYDEEDAAAFSNDADNDGTTNHRYIINELPTTGGTTTTTTTSESNHSRRNGKRRDHRSNNTSNRNSSNINNNNNTIPIPIHTTTNTNSINQCGYRTPICSYPNNGWNIIPAQLIVFAAYAMTGAGIFGCSFIRIIPIMDYSSGNNNNNNTTQLIDTFTFINIYQNDTSRIFNYNNTTNTTLLSTSIRTLGVLSWEDMNGQCVSGKWNVISRYYEQILLCDQHLAKRMGIACLILSTILAFWVIIVLSCVAHTLRYRLTLVVLLSIVLPICQSFLFTMTNIDLCDNDLYNNECEIGEVGTLTAISTILYFIAGLILLNPDAKIQRKYIRRKNLNNNNNNNDDDSHDINDRSNGIADAIEVTAVNSELIDRTLISYNATNNIMDNTTNLPVVVVDPTTPTTTTTRNDNGANQIIMVSTAPDHFQSTNNRNNNNNNADHATTITTTTMTTSPTPTIITSTSSNSSSSNSSSNGSSIINNSDVVLSKVL